jgi:soluble lytic murein transglycosylase
VALRVWVFGLAWAIALGAVAAQAQPQRSPRSALAPTVSPAAAAAMTAAIAAADRTLWDQARSHAAGAGDPVGVKIVEWIRLLTPGAATFDEIAAFIEANAAWPLGAMLERRAEETIEDQPDERAVAWFGRRPPRTADGKIRYAEALGRLGSKEASEGWIRNAWIASDLGPRRETELPVRFPAALSAQDHAARLERLLWTGNADAARRMYKWVDPDLRALGDARIALRGVAAGAERLASQVPAHLAADQGLVFDRARFYRRKNQDDAARNLLLQIPTGGPHAAEVWNERHALARRALRAGLVTDAYRLARDHGLTGGQGFADAEWFAGWVALRFLREAELARQHFERLADAARLPVSRARAGYWAALAQEALGKRDAARKWLVDAAAHPTTFYGQLAAVRLNGASGLTIPPPPEPTAEQAARYRAHEIRRALDLLVAADDLRRAKNFLLRLAEIVEAPGEHVLISRHAEAMGRPEWVVQASKRAVRAGINLQAAGYPTIAVPSGSSLEPALVLAITRQESEFDQRAVSRAGALGLMQLMPRTAQSVARSLHVPYQQPRLTADADYNMRLGSSYLEGLVRQYGGSYILAIAAYNAGPGRAAQWIRENGDPRDPQTDPVDWIESIGFEETRNYVQRVVENLQIYRQRLAGRAVPIGIAADLKRGLGHKEVAQESPAEARIDPKPEPTEAESSE